MRSGGGREASVTPRPGLSRRHVLVGGAAAVAGGGALLTAGPAFADTYTDLRDRWCDIVTGASDIDTGRAEFRAALAYLDARVADYLALVDRSSNRTKVFTNQELNQTTDPTKVTDTYNGLRWMALGWYTPGSAYHHDTALRADLLAGLRTVHDLRYKAGAGTFGNWWDWEIGSPKRLADILLLLDTELSAAERSNYTAAIVHFVPDPLRRGDQPTTGGNRTAMCSLAIVQGIASRSSARITQAVGGLPAAVEYVTADAANGPGEGLWADGSFIQHRHAYTGSYGRGLLGDLANLTALLAGTQWALTGGPMENLHAAVEQAFAPVIHDGRMMSFVNGRMVSYANEQEHECANGVIAAILRMARADVVDAATSQRWRGRCRGWLERARAKGDRDPYRNASVAHTGLVSEVLTGGTPALPEPEDSVIFRNMARAVHRRNGWAFAISMNSDRIARYESINGENLHGWHTGAGMTYLYDDDNTQYTDAFWATVPPQRLAGITVDRAAIADADGQEMSPWKWAGGAVLDGRYSAVGMSLQAAKTNLVGKKSWFCFDEVIVCMGRGIRGGGGTQVETIVENRNLHASGTNRLLVNGVEWTGADDTFDDAEWAHLEGVGGYLFPPSAGPVLRIQRGSRTGSWRDINRKGSPTSISRRYLGMALQHGSNPTDGLYHYLVVPKATPDRTAYLATVDRGITILAHHSRAHGVRQPTTGISMINFWDGHTAPVTAGNVTAEADCSVIVQELDDTLKIAVANPLRNDTTVRVTVTPAQAGYQLARKEDRVTVVSAGTSIVLDVASSVYGRPYYAEFAR